MYYTTVSNIIQDVCENKPEKRLISPWLKRGALRQFPGKLRWILKTPIQNL